MKSILLILGILFSAIICVYSVILVVANLVLTYQAIGTSADIAVLFTAPLVFLFTATTTGSAFAILWMFKHLKKK